MMEMNDILLLSDDKTTVLSVKDKDVKSVIIPDRVQYLASLKI